MHVNDVDLKSQQRRMPGWIISQIHRLLAALVLWESPWLEGSVLSQRPSVLKLRILCLKKVIMDQFSLYVDMAKWHT